MLIRFEIFDKCESRVAKCAGNDSLILPTDCTINTMLTETRAIKLLSLFYFCGLIVSGETVGGW